MSKTQIPWTDEVWNPISGCTQVSAGCANCYAARMVNVRHSKNPKLPKYYGKPFDLIQCHEDALLLPLRRKKPQRIFVNSMGDLFHPGVPNAFIDKVFAVMGLCFRHTFQILTKRPERMRHYLAGIDTPFNIALAQRKIDSDLPCYMDADDGIWPLPNVQLGVSVEDQATANTRIPPLLETPAAFRFVSAEPLLAAIDLYEIIGIWQGARALINALTGETHQMIGYVSRTFYTPRLDLVISGGETGPRARPANTGWFRLLRDDCGAAHVPFHLKSLGEWAPGEYVKRTKGSVEAAILHNGGCDWWEYYRENLASTNGYRDDNPDAVYRIGKKAAGCMLDRRTWDGAL